MHTKELSNLETEEINAGLTNLHQKTTFELVKLMNHEDRLVSDAVSAQSESITQLTEEIIIKLNQGGRLIYVGAGTSGRLGVLDASECVPTFNSLPELIQGHIAGGDHALRNSIEGAEDSFEDGASLIHSLAVNSRDAVLGITASGRTPFVLGALAAASEKGAFIGGIACNRESMLHKHARVVVEVLVGPEFIAGSTRLKSGTATKLVLNMISTIAMIRMGKVYKNLMIDLKVTNKKLRERAENMIIHLTQVSKETARQTLIDSDDEVRTALIVLLTGVSAEEARLAINLNGKNFDETVEAIRSTSHAS